MHNLPVVDQELMCLRGEPQVTVNYYHSLVLAHYKFIEAEKI